MDFRRAFRSMFDDPAWFGKLALVFVFEILVVTIPAVVGYMLRYVRNVSAGADTPLPQWRDFGHYWVKGFGAMFAALVYIVVGLLLFIVGIIPAAILYQAAFVEYAMTEEFGSLFAIGKYWRRITTYTDFWLALVTSLGLGLLLNVLSSVFRVGNNLTLMGVGGILTALLGLYVYFVVYNLYGQYAGQAYAAPPQPPGYAAPSGPSGATPKGGGYAPPTPHTHFAPPPEDL